MADGLGLSFVSNLFDLDHSGGLTEEDVSDTGGGCGGQSSGAAHARDDGEV